MSEDGSISLTNTLLVSIFLTVKVPIFNIPFLQSSVRLCHSPVAGPVLHLGVSSVKACRSLKKNPVKCLSDSSPHHQTSAHHLSVLGLLWDAQQYHCFSVLMWNLSA